MNGRNGIALLAIAAGVDVNTKDWEGDTALLKYVRQMYGGSAGQDGVVNHLTRSGADLEVRDRDGRTALFFAVDHNQLGAVKALVEAGAKRQQSASPSSVARPPSRLARLSSR